MFRFNNHPQGYLILIASPRQQWLCEYASMLRYTVLIWLVFHPCVISSF